MKMQIYFSALLFLILCCLQLPLQAQANLSAMKVEGTLSYANDTGLGPYYDLGIITNGGREVVIKAVVGAYENVSSFDSLVGKRVGITYAEQRESTVYDMRLADDNIQEPLHETSAQQYPNKETYSIIGRYVYSEVGDMGTYFEIEGRDGTIYNVMTLVVQDSWADHEVECALYVDIMLEATAIEVLD